MEQKIKNKCKQTMLLNSNKKNHNQQIGFSKQKFKPYQHIISCLSLFYATFTFMKKNLALQSKNKHFIFSESFTLFISCMLRFNHENAMISHYNTGCVLLPSRSICSKFYSKKKKSLEIQRLIFSCLLMVKKLMFKKSETHE